jgi:serine/threonine protein phosphatase PrpC
VKERRLMEAGLEEWCWAAASARGSQHDRRRLPNQDAVAVSTVDGQPGALVAAVADGHGGDRYVRSDVGSRYAVEVACAAATALLSTGATLREATGTALRTAIVDRWRQLVQQDAAARPFGDDERGRAGTPLDAEPEIAYGATLLLTLATQDGLALLQLGDGDIVVATAARTVVSPVPSDDRLVAGMTTSLCLPTAVDDFRVALVPAGQRPDLVLVASDGYGNSFASSDWREAVMTDLRRVIATGGLAAVERNLPAWAAQSAEAAGDDVTVAVLQRTAR